MKYILMAAVFAGGPIPAVVNAEETPAAPVPSVRLLEAARTAGAEASPLVFDRENGTESDAVARRGISGKSIVLATAIASVAAVTVAWLLRPRSECVPGDGVTFDLARALSWRNRYSLPPPPPPPTPEGVVPPPLPVPAPPPPLPDFGLCVARGSFR